MGAFERSGNPGRIGVDLSSVNQRGGMRPEPRCLYVCQGASSPLFLVCDRRFERDPEPSENSQGATQQKTGSLLPDLLVPIIMGQAKFSRNGQYMSIACSRLIKHVYFLQCAFQKR